MQLELSEGHENWHKGHVRNFVRLEGLGFDHATARIFAHEAHKAVCFWEKLQLELLEDHKYWHVGEVECC